MSRRRKLGSRIESHRKHKGLSALELSTRLGFGMNYIRSVERGLRLPSGEALERIASALELSEEERSDLFRIADVRPMALQEATAGLCFPGIVLFKHLPALLWSVPHDVTPAIYNNPDDALIDVVRSAASLLGWVSLATAEPTAEQIAQLVALLERTDQQQQQAADDDEKAGRSPRPRQVITALPRLWREVLFSSRKPAEQLVKRLSLWGYTNRIKPEGQELVGFRFADSDLNERFGLRSIPPTDVLILHDVMVFGRLWQILDQRAPREVAGKYGFPLGEFFTRRFREQTFTFPELPAILDAPEEALRSALNPEPDKSPDRREVIEWQRRLCQARFWLRTFEEPYAASCAFDQGWESTRDQLSARCAMLEGLLIQARPRQ